MRTTIETLTTDQIRALLPEAAPAGDSATVDDCETALSRLSGRDGARARIVAVIQNSEAQSSDD
ncbi:MAG: hypothetical protein EHM35_01000 [Planctomycetaceae bacterium]|nr:MAG: hypothetical protein EHM35_01000 [Planctomycetaceae bacterium]